jgi:hypothetical protein
MISQLKTENTTTLKEICRRLYGNTDKATLQQLRELNMAATASTVDSIKKGTVIYYYPGHYFDGDGGSTLYYRRIRGDDRYTDSPEYKKQISDRVIDSQAKFDEKQLTKTEGFELKLIEPRRLEFLPDRTSEVSKEVKHDWGHFTELTFDESLTTGSRALEVKMPLTLAAADYNAHRYGNRIILGLDGGLLMAGNLLAPDVSNLSGRVISWTAQSDTYKIINSHFNPSIVDGKAWNSILPYDAIIEIAVRTNTGISMSTTAEKRLKEPYYDADGQQDMANDILTMTPYDFIMKMTKGAGLYIRCDARGHLIITDMVSEFGDPVATIVDGDDNVKIKATFNYGELGRTYSIYSQRRGELFGSAEFINFPFPIFKNINKSASYGKYEDGVQFEISRRLQEAIRTEITLPGATKPDGTVWASGDIIKVRSDVYGLFRLDEKKNRQPIEMVVRRVRVKRTKDGTSTTLWPIQVGAFDHTKPIVMPFLEKPGYVTVRKTITVSDDNA